MSLRPVRLYGYLLALFYWPPSPPFLPRLQPDRVFDGDSVSSVTITEIIFRRGVVFWITKEKETGGFIVCEYMY